MSNALRMLPLCQLKRCKNNVRKTDRSSVIEQLAASIEANGVLENLIVRRLDSKDTEGPDLYEVVAGERRRTALKLLARRKKIPADHRVPCLVLKGDAQVTEVSLAENIVRAPLHPADQFEAFLKLQKDGLPVEDIAARFGLSSNVVLQRLKLAAVSPRLMAVYRSGEMSLEQLIAFTISDDHGAQEAVWFERPFSGLSSQDIRRLLTRALVDGADRRARFIGAKAYEAAGGVIVRDLFQSESEGYLADSQLLDQLVAKRLGVEAEALKAEGWGWVEVVPEVDHGQLVRFGRARPREVSLSDEEEAQIAELSKRYDELVAAIEEEGDEEAAEKLGRITEELDALRAKKEVWPDEDKAVSGAILSLEYDGSLKVMRGLVKPEHRPAAEPISPQGASPRAEEKRTNGYSESLLVELSAHRTAALREILAGNPVQAMTALLHVLVLRIFFAEHSGSCIEITPAITDLRKASQTVGESKAALALVARHNAWAERLPEIDHLRLWLNELPSDDRLELLAYCIGLTIDALHRPGVTSRKESADQLCRALGLDMADWWRPTQAGFFDRITKDQILAAVAEGVSRAAIHPLTGRKKSQIGSRAEELLAPTRWLPEPLRTPIASEPNRAAAE